MEDGVDLNSASSVLMLSQTRGKGSISTLPHLTYTPLPYSCGYESCSKKLRVEHLIKLLGSCREAFFNIHYAAIQQRSMFSTLQV